MRIFHLILFLVATIVLFSCKKDEPQPDPTVAKIEYNVSYGSHTRHKMDVYLPANRSVESTKLLIYIHGGGWAAGDKSDFAGAYPTLNATLENYAFISMNYRLCDTVTGANKFPAQELDVIAAINFIKTKLSEWKISNKVVICGGSAGGHLALLHGYKNNSDGFIKGIINYFGPTDMESLYPYSTFTSDLLDHVIGGPPAQEPAMYYSSSPVNYITSSSIPTITFHGTYDPIVPIQQSELLQQTLQNNGVFHQFEHYVGEGHGFSQPITLHSFARTKEFLDIVNP